MDKNRLQLSEAFYKAVINTGLQNVKMSHVIKQLETENLSLKVANRINRWIDRPYTCSEQEDIEMFAKEITEFILSEVKEK